jgi:hypothetical protein
MVRMLKEFNYPNFYVEYVELEQSPSIVTDEPDAADELK